MAKSRNTQEFNMETHCAIWTREIGPVAVLRSTSAGCSERGRCDPCLAQKQAAVEPTSRVNMAPYVSMLNSCVFIHLAITFATVHRIQWSAYQIICASLYFQLMCTSLKKLMRSNFLLKSNVILFYGPPCTECGSKNILTHTPSNTPARYHCI